MNPDRNNKLFPIIAISLLALLLVVPLVFSIVLAVRLIDITKSQGELEASIRELGEKVDALSGTDSSLSVVSKETYSAEATSKGSLGGDASEEGAKKDAASGRKRVYITFDDGPSVYTGQILDTLKKYGAKATFFVCGTGDEDDAIRPAYKRIVDEGHTIGMHSYSHIYDELYYSAESFEYDLDKIRDLIYNETNVASRFYRFPGGSGNKVSAHEISTYIPKLYAGGIEYYDWNVYPGDASGGSHSAEEIVANTLEGVDKVDCAIIVLHDTGAKKSTVDALPGILEGLRERDCEILPFDEDTPVIHQVEPEEDEER